MNGEWIRHPNNEIAVVFLHGILSNSEKCWTAENGVFWPGLLSEEPDLKEIGIYTFNYSTNVFSGSYSLNDVVDSLKEQLKLDDVLKNKFIIFICHSMGGIVARKFIVERQVDLIKINIKIGLYLVASPSLGSEYANLIAAFAKILKIRNEQAQVLRFSQNNTWLNDLDKCFINLKESNNLQIHGKELIEDKSIIFNKIITKQIVEPFSGAKYFGEQFKVPNSDHLSIAKPQSKNDIQHRLLCAFINDLIKNVAVNKNITSSIETKTINFINKFFSKRLDDSLKSFASQPKIWVNPIISKVSELDKEAENAELLEISTLISYPKSIIIKAHPQFGLTCLAHYLIKEAYLSDKSNLWLYLDAKNLKPHKNVIEKAINIEIEHLGSNLQNIKCVVLDSWMSVEIDDLKLLQKVCNILNSLPIIVMQTIDNVHLINKYNEISIDRTFDVFYLWSLNRKQIREIVSEYNSNIVIGEDSTVLNKIASDLEVLNLHRTPLNCITLLKVSEIDFDESPVNRTEILKKMLYLLFNVDKIPSYKTKPDLKDCEFVLGYFCEILLKNNEYLFTRKFFIDTLISYCKERLIDLELHIVFDVLYENNIIVSCMDLFRFKFAHWVYYFLAQRMHHNQLFSNYIFEEIRYAKFPEVIEFYTGIDRKREDALKILTRDLAVSINKVKHICGFPEELNPYQFAKWNSSLEIKEKMQNVINEGVKESNLPDSIKDTYADRNYDPIRPYYQDIQDIIGGQSFVYMMQGMRAASKSLRNSDYADPDTKQILLQEILNAWDQTAKVLMTLLPILADKGQANFDGTIFKLVGDFGESFLERIYKILLEIPSNIIHFSQDDLFSQKMGPLLIAHFVNEENELKKHVLALLLIHQRPRDWKLQIEKYIESVKKDSFYLLDVFRTLQIQYRYSFVNSHTLNEIEFLIKFAAAKHTSGRDSPKQKHIKRISNRVIPKRLTDMDH